MSEDCMSSTITNLEDEQLYPVEKIVGRRIRKGKVEYLVRWKNYSPDTDSWEPSKSLSKTCHPLIKEFNKDSKLLNNSHSIPTSTESSNDTPILNNKDNGKIFHNEMNFFDKHLKSPLMKHSLEFNAVKSKSKENCKIPNISGKEISENNEKRQFVYTKLNDIENLENSKNLIKVNGKDCLHIVHKTTPNDIVNKSPDSDLKNQKKVLYLENNEIDEPFVPKSRHSSINGVLSNMIVRKPVLPQIVLTKSPEPDKKSNIVISKSLTDYANNLKRKSISVVIGNQKKTKFSEKDFKINPISVIENDQIQQLKKLISNSTLDCNSAIIKCRTFKPTTIAKPRLVSEDKMEKCLRNLPYQRYKESEHLDNGDSAETRRTSIRQIEAANRFREIIVRKNVSAGFTEICLHNNSHSHSFPNSFNIKILNELHIAFKQAINDSSRVILLSAIGSVFSSGIDLESIISYSQKYITNLKTTGTTTAQLATPQHPNQQIHDLAESLKKFVLELLHFPKPIVVGINGPAIGLGCAILPLCDLIYATESSSFYLPYTTLSQIPEAGSSLTLPMLVGMPTANQLLLCGRKWSAKEALNRGLISEIIFSDKFKAELFSRCEKLARVSSMSAETMKCMLRIHYKDQIDLTINMECRKLIEIWKTNEFRNSAQSFLENELPNLIL